MMKQRQRHDMSPHWIGDHNSKWIKVDNNKIHISAKAMNIVWGNDNRFWNWVKLPQNESCFEVGAEITQVNYLEVIGSFDLANLLPGKRYEIIYLIKFKADAFGWHTSPILFEVLTPDGKKVKLSSNLEKYKNMSVDLQEVYGGEFKLPSKLKGKVGFRMSEVKTDWWKAGLILEGVILRPK